MKVELVKKSDNPLLKRTEIEFKVDHTDAPTPKRLEVRAQLAALLGSPDELLVIDKLSSTHGRQMAAGIARLYASKEELDRMEPAYLLKRGLPKETKEEAPAAPKPEKKPEAPKPEKKPEAKPEPKAEKPAEKPKEVKKEKAGEGKSGKEG